MTQKVVISSLEELIKLLDNSTKTEYKVLGKRVNIPLSDFEPYLYFDSVSYTRNCIKRTKHYELLLLCWEKGQATPIHCHSNQECWVHVLQGDLHEVRYTGQAPDLEVEHELDLIREGISYMNDDMGFHSLANMADGRSVTLHLYMNPIDECQVYDKETQEFQMVNLNYHTYQG